MKKTKGWLTSSFIAAAMTIGVLGASAQAQAQEQQPEQAQEQFVYSEVQKIYNIVIGGAFVVAQLTEEEYLAQKDQLDAQAAQGITIVPSVAPVEYQADTCVKDAQGNDYTVTLNYSMAVSLSDLANGETTDEDLQQVYDENVPDFMATYGALMHKELRSAWKEAMAKHSLEDYQNGDEGMTNDLQAEIEEAVLDFEIMTGISVAPSSITGGGATPGCK